MDETCVGVRVSTVAAEVGREVYALRSIPPGSVIVSDPPLVAYAPPPTATDPTHCSVCLACASAGGASAIPALERCGGPCGCVAQCQTCRDSDRHAGFECALLVHRLHAFPAAPALSLSLSPALPLPLHLPLSLSVRTCTLARPLTITSPHQGSASLH